MSSITADRQVAGLVTEKPSRAKVFEKHRIDYCCGGKIPLQEACEKKHVAVDQLLNELKEHDAETENEAVTGSEWTKAPLRDLIDNIVSVHHGYLRVELPRLLKKAERVAAVHGAIHPETVEVLNVFGSLKNEFEEHMEKEEGILFPWIRGVEEGSGKAPFPGMKMQQPVACMEHDHEETAKKLEKLRELTGNFIPPDDACNTYSVLYTGLSELEEDIHEHVHKENNILFPRALELAG